MCRITKKNAIWHNPPLPALPDCFGFGLAVFFRTLHLIHRLNFLPMQRFGLLIALWIGLVPGLAQVPAFTATGDTIIIQPDGTLTERKPALNSPRESKPNRVNISNRTGTARDDFEENRAPRPLQSNGDFPTNPFPYRRPSNATLYLPDPDGMYRAWFDPNQWVPQPPSSDAPNTEVIFSFRKAQAVAMLIVEPTEVPLPQLVEATVANLEDMASNVRAIAEEYRDVNDRFVLCVRIDGSLRSENFTYYNYYYSGDGYTLQFTLYASRQIFLQHQEAIRELMNGLVVK